MVYIVDELMGSGKTTGMINYINRADDNQRFIYITPYLPEVNRVVECCKSKHFLQPYRVSGKKYEHDEGKTFFNKTEGLRRLLHKGVNIVTTHSLFFHFDDEMIETCKKFNYTLVMDEVANVARPYNEITKYDIQVLTSTLVEEKPDHTLKWKDECQDYDGKYNQEKALCNMGCLTLHGKEAFIWLFPIKAFEAFKDTYILTYMFDAQIQKYYYDYHNVKYQYIYVKGATIDDYIITTEKCSVKPKYDYKQLITVSNNEKMNAVGDDKNALSSSWYKKNTKTTAMKKIKNNCVNFFNNICKSSTNNNIWTVYEAYQDELKGKGYVKGFLPCSTRATNSYSDRHCIAYLINFFMNPILISFFRTKGIEVNDAKYGLSEMLQFIWRSAIRKGEPISVYIPSSRMRNSFLQWLNEINKEYHNE